MAELNDDSVYFELFPELPSEPQTNVTPTPPEIIRDRYYYLLSSPELSQFSNAWKYLVNQENSPLAKFLNVGMPTYYNDFPFSLSILSRCRILQKNEKVLESNKSTISDTNYSLIETYNAFLRIMLEGDYTDNAAFIDVKLRLSQLIIKHFVSSIQLNGFIEDVTGNQDGQLINSNCLLITDFANTKIRLPQIIEIDSTSLNKNSNATAEISTTGNNEITFTSNGTLFDIRFNDMIGNSYHFPLCERYINQDSQFSYLLHGIRTDIGTGANRHIFAWFDGGSFTQQDFYHWIPVYGANLNTNQADTSQKIWYPKNEQKERMYLLGVDDDYYSPDLIPIS